MHFSGDMKNSLCVLGYLDIHKCALLSNSENRLKRE